MLSAQSLSAIGYTPVKILPCKTTSTAASLCRRQGFGDQLFFVKCYRVRPAAGQGSTSDHSSSSAQLSHAEFRRAVRMQQLAAVAGHHPEDTAPVVTHGADMLQCGTIASSKEFGFTCSPFLPGCTALSKALRSDREAVMNEGIVRDREGGHNGVGGSAQQHHLVRQAAAVLFRLHSGGMSHGDATTDSFVVDSKGSVTLIGFKKAVCTQFAVCFGFDLACLLSTLPVHLWHLLLSTYFSMINPARHQQQQILCNYYTGPAPLHSLFVSALCRGAALPGLSGTLDTDAFRLERMYYIRAHLYTQPGMAHWPVPHCLSYSDLLAYNAT